MTLPPSLIHQEIGTRLLISREPRPQLSSHGEQESFTHV
jgi:hypothetical protein